MRATAANSVRATRADSASQDTSGVKGADGANQGIADVERLAEILERHALTRLEYEQGGCRIVLEKTAAAPAAPIAATLALDAMEAPAAPLVDAVAIPAASAVSAAPAASTAPAAAPTTEITVVRTPLLGIAYRSREPGTAPLVSVGAQVNRNDVLCLVEAMKLFNEITAPISGVITAIHFEDGALVEHGAALVSITPLADSPAAQPPTALATSSAAQSPAASPASAAAQSPTPSATLPAAQSPAASPNPSTTSAG